MISSKYPTARYTRYLPKVMLMKLNEFKSRVLALLISYQPKNEREKQLIDIFVTKTYDLRSYSLPSYLRLLHEVRNERNTTEEFMSMINEIIKLVTQLDFSEYE